MSCAERRLNHSEGEAEKFYREPKARGISVRVRPQDLRIIISQTAAVQLRSDASGSVRFSKWPKACFDQRSFLLLRFSLNGIGSPSLGHRNSFAEIAKRGENLCVTMALFVVGRFSGGRCAILREIPFEGNSW